MSSNRSSYSRENWFFLFLCLLAVALSGCNSQGLIPLQRMRLLNKEHIASAAVRFCTMEPSTVKANLKFLFVVDRSTSNKEGGNVPQPYPATDPNGDRRYRPLESFLMGNADDITVSYGLIAFSTRANRIRSFSNQRCDVLQNIRNLHRCQVQAPTCSTSTPMPNSCSPDDRGFTSYLSALREAYNMIHDDTLLAKQVDDNTGVRSKTHYVVFFISDGAPRVDGGTTTVMEDRRQILSTVDSIMSLQNVNRTYVNSITLHTAYYYGDQGDLGIPPDAEAEDLMRTMANANHGKGDFYSFRSGQNIDFSQFAVPQRNLKHKLVDFFLTDLNTVWEDGDLLQDSDTDGISDSLELTLGSHPLDGDSDHNGVSDGVEYRTKGKPCTYSDCRTYRYTSCNFVPFDPKTSHLIDSDRDGLNDCEESEELLGTDAQDFDSNRDWVPDYLAFKRGLATIANISDSIMNPDFDEWSNYLEIKFHTPINFDNRKIIGLRPQQYDVTLVSSNEKQDCYEANVTEITIKGDADTLRAYVLETTPIIDDDRFMRVADKPVSAFETVRFSDEDFIEH